MTLPETRLTVLPEWIDQNGHMNVAYYVLAFDIATDAVYESWGLGERYPDESGCSVFTLGMDVDYLAELFPGDPVTITTQLLDQDHKRLHYFHRLYHGNTGKLTAVNECLAMNVHLETRRSAPFSMTLQRSLASICAAHQALDQPANWGRRLRIRKAD